MRRSGNLDRIRFYLSIVIKDSPRPAKRRRHDAAFRAEALRLAGESRSTRAAARALNTNPKRLYQWQKGALTPVAAAQGATLDPAAELRQLRAADRQQAQELEILKKPEETPMNNPMSRAPVLARHALVLATVSLLSLSVQAANLTRDNGAAVGGEVANGGGGRGHKNNNGLGSWNKNREE